MLKVWHKVIYGAVRDGGETHSIIPRFGSLEPVSRLGGSPGLIGKRRAFYGTVGVLVGIYLNSTAALAKVEEVSSDLGGSSNSISTPPIGLDIEDYDGVTDKDDVSKYHLEENIIPATVWSLRSNTGINLDRIQDGLESKIYTGSGSHSESPYYRIRTATALWSGNSIYTSEDVLLLPPPQFQVASCGGSHAEHRDLDYCSERDAVLSQETDPKSSSGSSSSGNNTTENASNNVTSSSDVSSSSVSNQSTPFSSMPVSSMPAFSSNLLLYGELTSLGPCGGVSASCATIHMDPPETPGDSPAPGSPTPPIDGLTPAVGAPYPEVPTPEVPTPEGPTPGPITYVDDPWLGSGLPPVFIPQPLKPIPEAPTWVMTIAGFGIMVFVFRKKRRPRINPVSIIDEAY